METRGAQSAYETIEEGTALAEPSRDIAAQYPAGQRMDHVSGFASSIAITSGRMTSCIVEQMMAGRSGH